VPFGCPAQLRTRASLLGTDVRLSREWLARSLSPRREVQEPKRNSFRRRFPVREFNPRIETHAARGVALNLAINGTVLFVPQFYSRRHPILCEDGKPLRKQSPMVQQRGGLSDGPQCRGLGNGREIESNRKDSQFICEIEGYRRSALKEGAHTRKRPPSAPPLRQKTVQQRAFPAGSD
jgi:hypothetical protein